ncbi:MAG: isochorismatase family protein [Dehalococcoidia bacterium]
MTTHSPKPPRPEAVTLDAGKTALLVLDLSEQLADPQEICSRLVPGITKFLDRARAAGVFIAFTISASLRGTPTGHVYSGFGRKPSEPVIYPDGFDKFTSGELQGLLTERNLDTLIIAGYRSNISVLNTATRATRELHYRVVIPVDGVVALTEYEQEYTLFQFTVLPAGAAERFTFSTLDTINFK